MLKQATYQIRVQGWIDKRWSIWFDEMTITPASTSDDTPVTVLTGLVPDQATLRGILNRLWDLNLQLISVTLVDADHSA